MSKLNTDDICIPEEMLDGWQTIANLLADIVAVPAALIMRVHKEHIEVFTANNNAEHPYTPGETENLNQGLYCETVINKRQKLLVANSNNDPEWQNNPDGQLGFIAYCGLPVCWPNGDVFGTICILDTKENHFLNTYQVLLESFRDTIEAHLKTLYQNNRLQQLNSVLKSRIQTRTQDLVELNYSLNIEMDKRRAAEQKIIFQQQHDLGTGFLNRAALELESKALLEEALTNENEHVALVHIGFANGRRIQSKYGYNAWDSVLVEYRNRLSDLSPYKVVTARPTSTDLAFLLYSDQIDDDIQQFCSQLLEISQSEFSVEGEQLHLHSFIGIATSKDTISSSKFLKFAFEAMLSCKDSGHKFSYYSQNLSDVHKNLNQLESYLLQAIRNDDLLLYFQPKVSPTTHQWIGAEALLRWRHPVLGDISNEPLIHLAEQNGLIFEVGSFVLRCAIEKASEWIGKVDDFKLAVNISAVQLQSPQFVEQVRDLLLTYQLPPKFLELEVTETGLIADEVIAKKTLTALSNLGVTLSLDDFGTGYASFNYLKKFPFDAIKVDKSFIGQLESNLEDQEIVRSIITIAKKLGYTVTAEGVETQKHESFIVAEGCDAGQGYLYGKPMPCDEFETNLFQKLGSQL